MIKKLQTRLIAVTMIALLLVLVLIVAGINIVNYCSVVQDADALLEILSENKGMFPERFEYTRPMELPPELSPEIPFETRYFSVILNGLTGDPVQIDTSRIAAVDRSEALTFSSTVINGGKNKGFLDDYRYNVRAEQNNIRIIFLDCGRKLDAFRSFLDTSIVIALICYIVVFTVVAFSSIRIIRPFSDNYEKQKRFVTDAGHEIKTPLTIINADVDVLEIESGENEWLTDIRKQTNRLATLTNDLIFLSRMEESETQMHMIEFPLSDVVSEVAASFSALAKTQNKQLFSEIQPMLSIRGNDRSIEQLVGLLLDNAIKYSPEGTPILLKAERQNRTVVLSVVNQSVYPIRKEELNHLFDRFYRADPSRNTQTGGYGIGLSMAKAIVNAHNGKIVAKPEDNNCLRITASFPT